MSAPVPLPLTWNLYTTVHCPSCDRDMHFAKASDEGGTERVMYCPNPECPQNKHTYLVRFESFAIQVVQVIK